MSKRNESGRLYFNLESPDLGLVLQQAELEQSAENHEPLTKPDNLANQIAALTKRIEALEEALLQGHTKGQPMTNGDHI